MGGGQRRWAGGPKVIGYVVADGCSQCPAAALGPRRGRRRTPGRTRVNGARTHHSAKYRTRGASTLHWLAFGFPSIVAVGVQGLCKSSALPSVAFGGEPKPRPQRRGRRCATPFAGVAPSCEIFRS